MDTASLTTALAPAFAAGFAVQRLLEILDPVTELVASARKKLVLGLASLIAGFTFAMGLGIRVLVNLGINKSVAPYDRFDLLDLFITALVISAGTEGFNSILKFLAYKKEEKKAEAQTEAVTAAATTVATLASQAAMVSAPTIVALTSQAATACNYTRQEIVQTVVGVYRQILGNESITRFSRFGPGKEIDIDADARRAFHFPIKQNVDREPSCIIQKLGPDDVQKAKTVGEIIDAICDEFGIS